MQRDKREGERGRRARDLRRLAVLPALCLGALAFAVPAHAGDELAQPPLPPSHVERSVTIVADVPEADVPDAQPAPAPVEPSAEAVPSDESAPLDDAVRPVETPANESPAPPSPGDPPAQATAPPTSSPSRPAAAVAPARAEKKPAPNRPARTPARQYQPPKPQYQRVPAQGLDIGKRHEAKRLGSKLTVPSAGILGGLSKAWRDIKRGGWNCAENIPQPSPLCPPDACEKLSWKCCWIDTCTSGIPVVEEPSAPTPSQPGTESSPSTCTGVDPSGTQYQSGDGQYQPPAGPDDEDFGDGTDDDTELDPCQQGPVVVPGTETTPPPTSDTSDATGTTDAVTPASEPAGPEATAATGQPPGSANSVSSSPPPADARPAAEPVVAVAPKKGTVEIAVAVAPVGGVLGETVSSSRARPARAVTRPARRPKPRPAPAVTVTSRPSGRAVAAPARSATSFPDGGSSQRLWLAFGAAALLAFGLSSVALVARGRPHASALAGVRARIGSRGLSANAPVVRKRPDRVASRGIRYRD